MTLFEYAWIPEFFDRIKELKLSNERRMGL